MADTAVLEAISRAIGAAHVVTDEEERALYGKDIYYERRPPLTIVSPGSIEEAQSVVRIAVDAGLTLAARGGGLSYSAGYLTDRDDTVLLDMRRLNEVVEINQKDMFVRV